MPSADFDLFDWTLRYDDVAGALPVSDWLAGGANISGAFDGEAVYLRAGESLGAVSYVQRAVAPLSDESYTLEVELRVYGRQSLPETFGDPEHLVGAGCLFTGVRGIGVVVTQNGLALVDSATPSVVQPLPGTESLITDGATDLVVRCIVSGANATVYWGAAPVVYDPARGSSWAQTPSFSGTVTRSLESWPRSDENLSWAAVRYQRVAARAAAGLPTSVRGVSVGILALRASPAPRVPPALPVAVASVVAEGGVNVPARLTAEASTASGDVEYRWDIESMPDGASPRMSSPLYGQVTLNTAPADQLQVFFREATRLSGEWVVSVVQGDSVRVRCTSSTRTLTVEAPLNATAGDVLAALTAPGHPGFDQEAWDRFSTTALPAATLDGPMDYGDFELSAGAASISRDPTLLVDMPGVYTLRLSVGNGIAWSLPDTRVFVARPVDQLLGARPNGDFFFAHLSDFWRHVRNRGILSDYWSAAMQTAAASLTDLWQTEATDDILQMTGVRQRRWYRWDMTVDAPADVRWCPRVSASVAPPPDFEPTSALQVTALLSTTVPAAVWCSEPSVPPQVVPVTVAEPTRAVTGSSVDMFHVVDRGQAGLLVADPLAASAGLSNLFFAASLRYTDVVPGRDYLRLGSEGAWEAVTAAGPDGVRFAGAPLATGTRDIVWEIRRRPEEVTVTQSLGLVYAEDPLLQAGDLAYIEIDTTEGPISLPALVVAANERHVVLDDTYLSVILSVMRLAPEDVRLSLRSVLRSTPLNTEPVVSVPSLAPSTLGVGLLREGADYTVRAGELVVLPEAAGLVDVTDDVLKPVNFVADPSWVGRWACVAGRMVIITEATPDGHLRVSTPVLPGRRADFALLRYTPERPPPSTLWSELVLFDDTASVESRFGGIVGFMADDVVAGHYPDAVRAVWFAMVKGPTIAALEQAVLGLVGVASIHEAGQIVEAVLPSGGAGGEAVVLHDAGHTTLVRMPAGSTFAINPRTSEPFTVGDPGAAQADKDPNSLVRPGDQIVDAGAVEDYISNPDLVPLSPADYHRFRVTVPAELLGNVSGTAVIRRVLERLAPAHTWFDVATRVALSEDIALDDAFVPEFTLVLPDSLYSVPASSTPTGGGSWVSADYENTWPVDNYGTVAEATEVWHGSHSPGFLDDFAGDGSWSPNIGDGAVCLVNRFNPDIAVAKSLLVLPVEFVSAAGVEFELDEFVSVGTAGGAEAEWAASPPRVRFLSAAPHPRLPFNIYAPQAQHPKGFMVLSFDVHEATDVVEGRETRLNAIKLLADRLALAAADIRVIGQTSGALATPAVVPDLDDPAHIDRYFLLRYTNQVGINTEFTLHDLLRLQQTIYVPFGGVTLADVEAASPVFDPATSPLLQLEPGYGVYDPSTPDDEQLTPSFSPGLHTDFDLSLESPDFGGGAATKANTYLRYGWDDVDVQATPTALGAFTYDAGQDPLENVHVGVLRLDHPRFHYTHGFAHFDIPEPVPILAGLSGGVVRVEGGFFIAPDPGATNPPDITDPASYNGTLPGAWVYLYSGTTYYPLTAVVFETGTAGGRTVLGVDGAVQTSTGHVLEGGLPAGLPDGTYDLVVANFYPWKMGAAEPTQVHVDYGIISDAFTVVSGAAAATPGGGIGTGILGIDPFGF